MNKFIFTVEKEAFEGVKRIAVKVAKDFEKVCGERPVISEELIPGPNTVIFATLDKSPLVDKLISDGEFEPSEIRGKREVYRIKKLENQALLICGSDKRGTVYGMFALSEYIGVSPLHFWGDVEPIRREKIEITKEIEVISKEPDVKYRGFFINDEWPCFGTWTFERFGGFTAEMYDHVFELLLRLKGNYLWPAMWTSSFGLDGPGGLNEELADIYGVVMGASHHEPCLRASEEWDLVRGEDSPYGNEWDYYTNKDGLIKYWEDGLKRSGKYEKIITLGMRGERDSSMLGDNAALKDNIDLLKDIIKNQHELITKNVNPELDKVPRLLALYKEVEEYFYGNSEVEGLKYWDELDGVICMLCEDNFGFMRTLPTADVRERRGGWGMYYHFDYHGGPISYEWMPSTSFERTWEQMSMAYDYGIKDVWIVNVGDLKFNEVSLAYFMELAYNFESYGTNAPNKIDEYTAKWLTSTFPSVELNLREKMAEVLHGYIRMNAMRRPEAQNPDIYHPCHYGEADRVLALCALIEKDNEEIYREIPKNAKDAYYSLIYFPAKVSVNLVRMHIYAGKNMLYAKQGKTIANKYADLVTDCIEKDKVLMGEFGKFKDGKWEGMELEQHIGFVVWNEDNCRYPLRVRVEPAYKPRMTVSRADRENIYHKTYGSPMKIIINDFMYAGNDEVVLEIANDGIGSVIYNIKANGQYDWLEISSLKGEVECQEEIILRCNRDKLTDKKQTAELLIKDEETVVAIEINAKAVNIENLPPMTFLENNGVTVIDANHFCADEAAKSGAARFVELENYGRTGTGMKVFPTTVDFSENDEKPNLTYRFLTAKSGEYVVEVWTTPTNSVQNKRPLRFMLGEKVMTAVPADFRAGSPGDRRWCIGVLDNIRVTKTELNFEAGVNELKIAPLEAGLILERIVIYKKGDQPYKSYLGPEESFCV
ncbi:MAG: glycosyl hydrolase 115 family protein [Oscillospiraceae bacterium]|nr:glycosyl hydrolase 115 family protein [Oscillospiraceae bacterium]